MAKVDEKDPIALVQAINASVEDMKKDQKEIHAAIKLTAETAGTDAKAAVKTANDLAEKITAQATMLTELEQKLAEGVKNEKAAPRTLGEVIIKSEEFLAYASGKTNKMRVEANTITGQSGSPAANSDVIVAPDRRAGIIPGAFRSLRIKDALLNSTTSSNLVEYTRELAFTNGAAEVAEGDTKPQASLTFELVSAPVRTIAHWLKASKQVLDDAPALQSYIDNRLRYGVELRWDSQLLMGNGTGQNISGILKSGNFTAFTPTASENGLDGANRIQEAVALADYAPTAYIMHTSDWHILERLKVGTSDTRYIIGDPLGVVNRVLWGLPVILSNNMKRGTVICAAFDIAYEVWNRMGTVVEMFEQDDTNVQKNLVTIRAEARGCLATNRPASSYAGLLFPGASA